MFTTSWESHQRACAWSHACESQAHLNTTLCSETGMEELQTVVVTVALVSDLNHSENIVLLKTLLTDSVHGKSLLVVPYQRHLAACIIRSPFLHHHDRSFHCIRRNLLHPLRGSHGAFLSDLVRVRHDNAFSWCCCMCLSHIVSDSDVDACVSVSCSRSCLLTSAGFRSCGVLPGSILRSSGLVTFSICFPAHVSHIALLPEVALASAPVPICSKIWEVCFDVNTVLDDPPINSGGATRSRHCSFLGGATRRRHDDAISGKRLTVPCDSDFLLVSVIRGAIASQHTRLLCSPTVLNTGSLVISSAARGVF